MKQMLFIAMVGAIISCSQNIAHTHAPFDITPATNHIIEMNKTYSKRFTTNDTAYYNARYCNDAQVMSPNVPTVIGRDSIIKFFYGDGKNTEAVIELPAGNIYGNENLVVEEGSYNFPDGKGGSFDKGKFIALWKQEDGIWKLFREIWNTDNPPPSNK
jgi:ketosteroid isomerase-like protein